MASASAARVIDKKYLPTAYVQPRLPAGSAAIEALPTMEKGEEDSLEERLER